MLINSFISQQEINVDALKKDPVLIQYKKVMIELKDGIASNQYKLPKNVNYQKEMYTSPTKENMVKVLKGYGMINAAEYVDKIFLQTKLMFNFLKKHPELSKLDLKKRSEIISKLIFD